MNQFEKLQLVEKNINMKINLNHNIFIQTGTQELLIFPYLSQHMHADLACVQ